MQSFKWFCKNLQTFRNSGGEKKVVKCYNHWSTLGILPQRIITCSNFVLSTTGSDSVMYAKFQINLMRYGEFPNEQRYKRDSLWRLEVESWRVWKTTKIYPRQFKVGFPIKEDCFTHLCKVSSDLVRIWKLSRIQAEKKVVKCYNHRSTLGTLCSAS